MLCLDTNIVIGAINLRPAYIRARLDAELASGVEIGIPSIVLFEMRYGAAKSVGAIAKRIAPISQVSAYEAFGSVALPSFHNLVVPALSRDPDRVIQRFTNAVRRPFLASKRWL